MTAPARDRILRGLAEEIAGWGAGIVGGIATDEDRDRWEARLRSTLERAREEGRVAGLREVEELLCRNIDLGDGWTTTVLGKVRALLPSPPPGEGGGGVSKYGEAQCICGSGHECSLHGGLRSRIAALESALARERARGAVVREALEREYLTRADDGESDVAWFRCDNCDQEGGIDLPPIQHDAGCPLSDNYREVTDGMG